MEICEKLGYNFDVRRDRQIDMRKDIFLYGKK